MEEPFPSLAIAFRTIRALEDTLGHQSCAFRWRLVMGSTSVVGEFWFP